MSRLADLSNIYIQQVRIYEAAMRKCLFGHASAAAENARDAAECLLAEGCTERQITMLRIEALNTIDPDWTPAPTRSV